MKITGNEPANGLTIRQQLAMAAMQGFCANSEMVDLSYADQAEDAVKQADLLINELNKTKT